MYFFYWTENCTICTNRYKNKETKISQSLLTKHVYQLYYRIKMHLHKATIWGQKCISYFSIKNFKKVKSIYENEEKIRNFKISFINQSMVKNMISNTPYKKNLIDWYDQLQEKMVNRTAGSHSTGNIKKRSTER